ncbi:avenin-3-like [Lolium rigidum]|uniref:avenin-3-like n=1 Tax=Lolium rigidum TaxID=89674 RepID=UPI001F5DFCD3|nr:avenin-3-like [Lolium rigidum]
MKTFLILTFLSMAVTIATANVQLISSCQYQPQQPFQPFPGQQMPFSGEQQLIPGQQLPFPGQQEMPIPWQQLPISGQQQPFPGQQLSYPQVQQLNPCREFLLQQCNPMTVMTFLRSQILQQSSCQVMRQQCCQQLAQIPEPSRCPAIQSIMEAIFIQQQQQQKIALGLHPIEIAWNTDA